MVRFEKGDKVYILESMGKKTVCSVVSSSGGFTIVRLPSGGAIRLRNSRIFPYEEEKVPAAKSPLEAAGYADPHRHMDETSRYGPMKLHGFSKTPLTYGGIKMSDKNSSFSLKIKNILYLILRTLVFNLALVLFALVCNSLILITGLRDVCDTNSKRWLSVSLFMLAGIGFYYLIWKLKNRLSVYLAKRFEFADTDAVWFRGND